MITKSGIIWCWSITDPENIVYIFRGKYDIEFAVDLRLYKGQNYSYIRLTEKERVFLNQLIGK